MCPLLRQYDTDKLVGDGGHDHDVDVDVDELNG